MHSGTVHGHGYNGQQKDAICDVRGLCQMIRSIFKPVCCWFRLIGYAYELLRCLDVEIWQFSWWQWQTDRLTNYFTPVHVRGVIMMPHLGISRRQNTTYWQRSTIASMEDLGPMLILTSELHALNCNVLQVIPPLHHPPPSVHTHNYNRYRTHVDGKFSKEINSAVRLLKIYYLLFLYVR